MDLYIIIIFLGLLIFFSHAFNELFDKTKIPNVLLLMMIGIILGPVTGIITKDFFGDLGEVFTTITLIVILFESGANLNLKDIRTSLGSASLLTIINFLATLGLTILIVTNFLGLDVVSAAFVGAIIGGTSSAVVIPMVKQLKMGTRSSSVLILESALSDVICLVVGLALLDGMMRGVVTPAAIFEKMSKALLFAILLGLMSGILWSGLIRLIRSIKNSMFISLAFVFVLYGVVEMLGFNGGISVLTFGIILGNMELIGKHSFFRKVFRFNASTFTTFERDFFSEIVFIVQTYFFVYVGVSIRVGSPLVYALSLLLVILIILVRMPGIRFLAGKTVTKAEKSIMSIMMPKGMVPAVLASIPLQQGLAHGLVIQDLGYSVVLFSIVICSFLVILLKIWPDFFDFRKKAPEGWEETDLLDENKSEATD